MTNFKVTPETLSNIRYNTRQNPYEMGFRYGSDNHFREITFTDCNNINHVEINVRTNTGYYDQTKLLDISFDLEIYVPPVNKGEQCTSDSNCADGDCIGGICCSGNYPGALSCETGTGYYKR